MSCEYNCRYCGQPMRIYEIEPHSHTIVNLPDYSGGWFAECTKCSCALTGENKEDLLEQLGCSPLSDPTPLSLEELQGMDGEPIWISKLEKWGILSGKLVDVDEGKSEYRLVIGFEYGWEWLDDVLRGGRCAYAQKPIVSKAIGGAMMRKVNGTYRCYMPPDKEAEMLGWHWQDFPFEGGLFHCWGSQVSEFENGGYADTVAIVELPDGQVVTVNPNELRFIDGPPEERPA